MFIIYTKDGEHGDGKMYFVDTKWGGPSYCNDRKQAYEFSSYDDAIEAKEYFEEELVVFEEHFIEAL